MLDKSVKVIKNALLIVNVILIRTWTLLGESNIQAQTVAVSNDGTVYLIEEDGYKRPGGGKGAIYVNTSEAPNSWVPYPGRLSITLPRITGNWINHMALSSDERKADLCCWS